MTFREATVHALLVLSCLAMGAGCGGGVRGRRLGADGVVVTTLGAEEGEAYQRGIADLRCPDAYVARVAQSAFRVQGCNGYVVYTCLRAGIYRASPIVCDLQDRGFAGPPPWSDEELNPVLARINDGVISCLPPERAELDVQLAIAADGSLHRTAELSLSVEAIACVDARLAEASLQGRDASPRTAGVRFQRHAPSVPATAQASVPPATPDAAARAAVDGRAPAILACTGEAALALQVSWTGDGRLDALLQGAQSGTAAEGCVRGIVQQLTIPTPGSAGSILHAIQR